MLCISGVFAKKLLGKQKKKMDKSRSRKKLFTGKVLKKIDKADEDYRMTEILPDIEVTEFQLTWCNIVNGEVKIKKKIAIITTKYEDS